MNTTVDNRQFGISNLSTDSIIQYLSVLEKKLPERTYSLYRPSIELVDVVTEELLEQEAKHILDFIGLGGYDVNVKFAKLENAVGQTTPGGINGVIPIYIDSDYKDWKIALATLAHEICHTLIFHYNLRPIFQWETEIYTDLATIITGLGNLTLGGCTATLPNGHSQTLGYLTIDNYTKTYHLVNTLRNCKNGTIGVCGDESIESLLHIWTSKGAREAHRSSIRKHGEKAAELQRNIQEIKNILSIYEKESNDIQSRILDNFIVNPEAQPCQAFQRLYLLSKDNNTTPWSLDIIENTLFNLYTTLDQKQTTKISNSTEYRCPRCGRTHSIQHDGTGTHILKCPCGYYFTATKSDWSPAAIAHQQSIEKNEQLKQQAVHDKEVINKFVCSLPKWLQRFVSKRVA